MRARGEEFWRGFVWGWMLAIVLLAVILGPILAMN